MANDASAMRAAVKELESLAAPAPAEPPLRFATVQSVGSDGTVQVIIDGADAPTPATAASVQCHVGNRVMVQVRNHKLYVMDNITDPAATEATVKAVQDYAETAGAIVDAMQDAADEAGESLADIVTAAAAASSTLSGMQAAAMAADTTLEAIYADAESSKETLADMQEAADAAHTTLTGIYQDAADAASAASSAQQTANQASTYATSALDQLGVVQDVVGVLNYVAQHGGFVLTQDQSIQEGKVYFTYDSTTGDYSPVIDPQASALSTYYEVSEDYDDVMGDFIMAHLAVTSRGLWVLPSGMGSSTTPATGETQQDSDARQGSGYKMLLSSGGSYIYDSNGTLVRSDTASGTDFASGNDWHMGGQDAYIFYDASEGTINIGGSSVTLGGTKTLAELMSEVDNTLILKISESYNAARSAVTCTAIVLQGGEDIASTFPSSCFAWYLKSEGGTYPLEPLGTGYTMTVSLSDAGYGAAVKCTFTPPNDAALLDSDDDSLTDSDDAPLSVRSPSGDYVRVADLATETDVFDTDKVMIVGSEDEHLATIGTLKEVFGDNDYDSLDNRPTIEDVELTGNKDLTDFGIFQTDSQGYSIPDDYTLTTTEINALWANAVTIG